jgi:protein required for attachment to host cells
MSTIAIRNGDWVVICDGRKALFTVNEGDAQYLNLKVTGEQEAPSSATRDLGSDRPGRVQQSMGGNGAGHGGSRSSVAQTDWHDQAEHEFLRTVADKINRATEAHEVKGLVVAAPPRALGVLKPLLSAAVHAVLHGTFDKDYVKMPLYEIEKHLKA